MKILRIMILVMCLMPNAGISQGKIKFNNMAPNVAMVEHAGFIPMDDYMAELVFNGTILETMPVFKGSFGTSDGPVVTVPGADSSMVNLTIRVYKSGFDSWEDAVMNGRFWPPSSIYLDIEMQTSSANAVSNDIPTLSGVISGSAGFQNGSLNSSPIFLTNNLEQHLIPENSEIFMINGKSYIMAEEVDSDYHEEIIDINFGSLVEPTSYRIGEYTQFQYPSDKPFLIYEKIISRFSFGSGSEPIEKLEVFARYFHEGNRKTDELQMFQYQTSRIKIEEPPFVHSEISNVKIVRLEQINDGKLNLNQIDEPKYQVGDNTYVPVVSGMAFTYRYHNTSGISPGQPVITIQPEKSDSDYLISNSRDLINWNHTVSKGEHTILYEMESGGGAMDFIRVQEIKNIETDFDPESYHLELTSLYAEENNSIPFERLGLRAGGTARIALFVGGEHLETRDIKLHSDGSKIHFFGGGLRFPITGNNDLVIYIFGQGELPFDAEGNAVVPYLRNANENYEFMNKLPAQPLVTFGAEWSFVPGKTLSLNVIEDMEIRNAVKSYLFPGGLDLNSLTGMDLEISYPLVLEIPEPVVTSFNGLEYFTKIKKFRLMSYSIGGGNGGYLQNFLHDDISFLPLSKLPGLEVLDVFNRVRWGREDKKDMAGISLTEGFISLKELYTYANNVAIDQSIDRLEKISMDSVYVSDTLDLPYPPVGTLTQDNIGELIYSRPGLVELPSSLSKLRELRLWAFTDVLQLPENMPLLEVLDLQFLYLTDSAVLRIPVGMNPEARIVLRKTQLISSVYNGDQSNVKVLELPEIHKEIQTPNVIADYDVEIRYY